MQLNNIIEKGPLCRDPIEKFPDLEDAVSKWAHNNSEPMSDELIHSIAGQEDKHSDIRRIFPESHISYAIDPEHADEVDDAIAYCEKEQAFFIHISDVTRYISPEGQFKRFFVRALENKCSMYLPSFTFGMLPAKLNEKLLSLGSPLSDGSVITIRLRSKAVHGEQRMRGAVSHPLSAFHMDVFLARIPPPRRLTYEQATAIIQNGASDHGGNLCTLYREFRTQFRNRMCMTNGDETCVKVSTTGPEQSGTTGVLSVETYSQMSPDSPARCLVTGMMCQAHEAAGRFSKVRSAGLAHLICNARGFHGRVRRITAPTRRVEDLLNHWQIKESLRGHSCDIAKEFMIEHRHDYAEFWKVLRDADADLKAYWASVASAEDCIGPR